MNRFIMLFKKLRNSLVNIPDKKNEFIENSSDIITITPKKISELKKLALKNSRKRIRQNLHCSMNDLVHEMIIVHTMDTYIRPHKHSTKSESFHLIEGDFTVLIFNDLGEVIKSIPMSANNAEKPFCYRLAPGIWHSLIPETDFVVFHETTSGPFVPNSAEFAPWSPDENDAESLSYLDHLISFKDKVV